MSRRTIRDIARRVAKDPAVLTRAGRRLLARLRPTRAWEPLPAAPCPRRLTRIAAAKAAGAPEIAVIVPMHETDPAQLRACIASVRGQSWPHWRLVLVDDASAAPHVLGIALDAAARDSRIRTVLRGRNGGVSRATNVGLGLVEAPYTAFLDHDDELAPDALLAVAERLAAEPTLDLLYTDQHKIDGHGRIVDHHHKPDWSPALLLGVMYVGHLLVVRTELARALGGFDPAFDGVQDYEFVLRASERTAAIGHIAQPLYRWRAVAGSLAADPDAKPGIEALQKAALVAHLRRRGRAWAAEAHPTARHRMLLSPVAPAPTVSVIIPSRDQGLAVSRCLDTLHALTEGVAFETVLVDDRTIDPIALAAFDRHPIRRVPLERAFSFSAACNLGASRARGELLLFLNNDTAVLQPDWLARLALWMEDPEVGAVGPVLLYPDRTVQHAGVVLGARGTADHAMRRFPEHVDGYAGSLSAAREVSAVTGACLMMRRAEFEAMGGFSTDYLKHYQDVDLCLRLRERGRRIVCASRPTLIHHESLTRAREGYDQGDRAIFIDRWRSLLEAGDPYYPAACDGQRLDYSLAAA